MRSRVFIELAANADSAQEREKILANARAWSRQVYGTEAPVDPHGGYEGKARVGHFHTIRPVIKDSVPVDDLIFPMLIDRSAPDYRVVLHDSDGNDIEGQDIEYHLFCLGTGAQWTPEQFEQAAARVYSLERALQVRHWGRDRSVDEMVLPFFERPETHQNPLQEKTYSLDRELFQPVLDEFYALHGWDPATGRPTREGLEALGLSGVYEQMTAGAQEVASRIRNDE